MICTGPGGLVVECCLG